MAANIDLNLSDTDFRTNPYPFYRQLRETDSLHWNYPGFWLVTRYADAMTILREGTSKGIQLSPIEFLLSHWMLSKNPPDHTRLRSLVSKAFTPGVIEGIKTEIQAIVDSLLDQAEAKQTFDLIAEVAYPLPVMIIAAMLGVPHCYAT